MERINADCTVDDLGDGWFEVTVRGIAPHDHKRVYAIRAVSDNKAAFEGLREFEDEMIALYDGSEITDGHAPSAEPAPTAH